MPSDATPRAKKKLTVAALLKLKGQRQVVLTTAFDEWTARAAEAAGVDMIVAWGTCLEHSRHVLAAVRRGAPNTLIGCGINPDAYVSKDKAIETANIIRAAGADVIYCSGLALDNKRPQESTWAALARQHFPCCGHVGYLPVNNTWYGGPRAVGKTAVEAQKVYEDVMAMEAAGCIAVEMECVPAKIAAEIAKRTKMLVFSMGSGPHCDGQFIFSEDILGTGVGRVPRHAYRAPNLNMMQQAVDAIAGYKDAVHSGAYPTAKHSIKIKQEELEAFLHAVGQ
jgi:3-methyl-2-oxobutanoate hydroxymethyltransferase